MTARDYADSYQMRVAMRTQFSFAETRGTSSDDKSLAFISGVLPVILTLLTLWFGGCTQFGPYHANTPENPSASLILGPDGPYKIAVVEFGENGMAQDTSQLEAARSLIVDTKAEDPLVIVYVHGWQNNADSADVCKFEHFIDVLSKNEEISSNHLKVIGVYLAWRGKSLNIDYVNTATFWGREQSAHGVANAVAPIKNPRALYTLRDAVEQLGEAVRQKKSQYHRQGVGPRAVLLGHSFGALVLEESISKDIEKAAEEGSGNAIVWDLAITLNSANDSQNSRQILQNFDTLYRHVGNRYVSIQDPSKSFPDYRTALISVTSETDLATGLAFPVGSWLGGLFKVRLLRDDDISNASSFSLNTNIGAWQGGWFARLPIPGEKRRTAWRAEFATTTPGHNRDLINWEVKDLNLLPGRVSVDGYKDAFDLNISRNRNGQIFYTSEPNDGRELKNCPTAAYHPELIPVSKTPPLWHKWQLVPNAKARAPYWIFTVPKDIIDGHGGIWSDNSIALLGALYRMQFPITSSAHGATPVKTAPIVVPQTQDLRQLFKLPIEPPRQ